MDAETTEARRRLRALPIGAPTDELFAALRAAVPIDAATLQAFRASDPTDITFVGFELPEAIRTAWLADVSPDVAAILAPLLEGAAGAVFTDDAHTLPELREHASVFRALTTHGLDHRLALCLSSRPVGRSDVEHRFLALLGRRPFTSAHCARLREIHRDVAAAVERMRLPLLSSAPILQQIVREQRHGYVCIGAAQRVVESNSAAYRLAADYVSDGDASALATLVTRAMSAYAHSRETFALRVHHACRRALLDASVHFLDADAHALPESLHLILLSEVSWGEPADVTKRLSKRQQQVAELLATTACSYREIADRLGLAEGTVRKHVELTYRALGVQSRAQLSAKWHRATGS